MKSERILISLPPSELKELDKYSEWLGASRSRLIQNALIYLFTELAPSYPESSLDWPAEVTEERRAGKETKPDGMD